MDTTESLARRYNTTPFDIMERDAEHVIMVINYLLEMIDKNPVEVKPHREPQPRPKQKDTFWDF